MKTIQLNYEDFNNIDVHKKESLLNIIYGLRGEKSRENAYKGNRTNGDLFMEFVNEVIEEWQDNTGLYKEDRNNFIHEFVDDKVDIYTASLFRWYSEDCHLHYYVDEAIREFGITGIIKTLQQGQYIFLENIVRTVFRTAEEKDLMLNNP